MAPGFTFFFFFLFLAAVFCGLAVVIAAIILGNVVARKIDGAKILGGRLDAAKITNAVRAGFAGRSAEIGENGLLPNLTLAQGGQIVSDGFFFVESDLAGVGAHETFVEDAAGKLVEVFVFQGAQHAGADLGGVGDGVERDAALLALFAKFFSERSHEWLRRAEIPVRMNRD